MYELKKKNGKVFTSKFVGTGPSSYKKRIYRAAVSQILWNTVLDNLWSRHIHKVSKEILLDVCIPCFIINTDLINIRVRGGVVFKALRYKQAGGGFYSRWCHWNFSVT